MFCSNCGKEIPDASKFCPYCGAEHIKTEGISAAVPEPETLPLPETAETAPVVPPVPAAVTQPVQEPVQQPAPQPAYGQQPAPQQQYAQQQPAYAQQPAPQQAYQQPGYGQQYYGQAAPGEQPAPLKKKSKLPIIIIAVVAALLIIGAGIIVAINVFGGAQQSALSALYEGTENLIYDTSSATVEITAGVSMTFKWDLGDDLKSSTFWGYSGGSGFIYKDDTIYIYESSGSDGTVIRNKTTGIVDELNTSFADEVGTKFDFNTLVKKGKLNRDAIDELNQIMTDSGLGSDVAGSVGASSSDVDSVRIAEIIDDFFSTEVSKESVYETFMYDIETTKGGSATEYDATFDPVALFGALSDYAQERGSNKDYAKAATAIEELCDAAEYLDEYVDDIRIRVGITKKVLTGLIVDVNLSTGAVSLQLSVSDLNETDLSKDRKLSEILDSPIDANSGGYDLEDLL
jgi:hypothetical protein